ncbi:MAG: flagellar basal body rod protein FlgB [Syntrophobacterales bacterium]|jgi:flagellar basal-body rod protein FlgB|nr:flagellar basal body rod protein FlgB [Syntrophobacterales bacterium]
MSWDPLAEPVTRLLAHSLTLRSRRQEVIAGNIANLDTPGYTARELPFQEVLRQYADRGGPLTPMRTHPGHLTPPVAAGLIENRGEPVDLDQEMVRLGENLFQFQSAVQLLNRKLEGLRTVLEGGRP